MEATTLDNILAKRLALIDQICAAFRDRGETKNIFLRGPLQREIISFLGIKCTGMNKRLINEALLKMGYRCVFIQGYRFYSKVK
jgi:hypothetical protein